jgi:hypothetical protein
VRSQRSGILAQKASFPLESQAYLQQLIYQGLIYNSNRCHIGVAVGQQSLRGETTLSDESFSAS